MIVGEVDIIGAACLETEDDPPVGPNGHRPEAAEVILQRMELEARQVHAADPGPPHPGGREHARSSPRGPF